MRSSRWSPPEEQVDAIRVYRAETNGAVWSACIDINTDLVASPSRFHRPTLRFISQRLGIAFAFLPSHAQTKRRCKTRSNSHENLRDLTALAGRRLLICRARLFCFSPPRTEPSSFFLPRRLLQEFPTCRGLSRMEQKHSLQPPPCINMKQSLTRNQSQTRSQGLFMATCSLARPGRPGQPGRRIGSSATQRRLTEIGSQEELTDTRPSSSEALDQNMTEM